MVIFKNKKDLASYLAQKRAENMQISFVPTMGALHTGHSSLIEKAKKDGGLVVCSIFVNPTQFNDKKDFEQYPVTEEADILMLIEGGCDVLFMPAVAEMYPEGMQENEGIGFGYLDTILEGAHRPGHFKGVGQIVARLLDIVMPDTLYMGQKDYQQCMVIKELLQQTGRDEATELVICPTRREADGLAMSSRNTRLTDPQRALSAIIYQCLVSIQSKQGMDNFSLVQKECIDLLTDKGFEPDYVALADANDLTLLDNYDESRPMIALIAAKIGNVRLIDNLLLNPVAEPALG